MFGWTVGRVFEPRYAPICRTDRYCLLATKHRASMRGASSAPLIRVSVYEFLRPLLIQFL
ncbi:Uncharacterized protein DBV15_02002 [Temnothorax longispinosus]|uniref:Uncharacterized protein n=1 Tax=Temnothorax longispinosus TaxID=300112 RepID=A0A4S2KJ62_9HYME|nr:Uncharacterized protein DBV15_02002 [Temnothorax longispinosus]